jgi:Kef-type K+ transport system membrane component KefB
MAQNAGTFATSLISFMMISLGAAYFGKILSRVKIPVITAYLLFGILAGPYVLELLEVDNVKNISAFINDLALATIAFVAGSELYFPHFKGLFSVIGIQLIFVSEKFKFLMAEWFF